MSAFSSVGTTNNSEAVWFAGGGHSNTISDPATALGALSLSTSTSAASSSVGTNITMTSPSSVVPKSRNFHNVVLPKLPPLKDIEPTVITFVDKFVHDILDDLKKSILEKNDQMPEDWDGHEIRQFIGDYYTANYVIGTALKGSRKRDYKNTCLVDNLL